MKARWRTSDRGLITLWAAVTGAAILAFVGIVVVDGGTVLHTRSRAFSIAGSAARAGTQALDDAAAVRGDVVLDPAAAEAAALAFLHAREVSGTVVVDDDEVTVTVHDVVDLKVYPGVVSVSATATAVAIETGGPP